MGYIQDNIESGEDVLFVTKRHWINRGSKPVLFVMLGGTCLLGVWIREWVILLYPGMGFVALGLLCYLGLKLRGHAAEFGVTTKRVVIKTGVLHRRTLELILQKIESIDIEQSILGRLLGYGTLTITGLGGSSRPYRNIARPMVFRMHVQRAIEALKRRVGR